MMKIGFLRGRLSLCGVALFTLAALFLSSACKREASFRLEGDVKNGDGISLLIEKAGYNGEWIVIDSVTDISDGHFAVDVASAGAPEIYRLAYNDQYIYFPVDSVETISIATTADAFGRSYSVAGSDQARDMATFDKELMALDFSDQAKVDSFKRNVFNKYIRDARGSLLSYYVLTKVVDGKALFDIANEHDAKYISAVATSFKQYKPDDPRAALIEKMAVEAQRLKNKQKGRKNVLQAQEVRTIDIELPGVDGRPVKLSDTLEPGKACVVAFTSVASSENPALLLGLKELIAGKGGRVKVYNVNVDGDPFRWKDTAANLPWTNVYASTSSDAKVFIDYNVGAVPVFFIYNAQGELVDRAQDISDLTKILGAY